jgi:hypothetical protein
MARRRTILDEFLGPSYKLGSLRATARAAKKGPGPLLARIARRDLHRVVKKCVRWPK